MFTPSTRLRPAPQMLFAAALRRTLREGYSRESLRADVLAGVAVGIVAIPLSMALGIAVGVAPQHGLYTAIVAGAVVALLGGSRQQVTGPTAAFVVILAPIVNKYGLQGLLTAGMMAGIMLVAMGAARLGRVIQFIPHPVTTGFTAGIATGIATLAVLSRRSRTRLSCSSLCFCWRRSFRTFRCPRSPASCCWSRGTCRRFRTRFTL